MTAYLFRNADVMAMDKRRTRSDAVLVREDKITWVGQETKLPSQSIDRVIDCEGRTLLPGFNDAHIHLLAYASSLRHIDCSDGAVFSIEEIQSLIRERARTTPIGEWIRGRGYDDKLLKEQRHLTSEDLDKAAPHHPVRIDHRSGHACVLNTHALAAVGINLDTPDPLDGVIERDSHGNPTGLLLEMSSYISHIMRDVRNPKEIYESAKEASKILLKWGVTSIQDASLDNDIQRWQSLKYMQDEGVISQRITFMPGLSCLRQFNDIGLTAGGGDFWLRLGHVKLMVTLTTGTVYPSMEEFEDQLITARRCGFPLAIHAVEEEALIMVLGAIRKNVSHCPVSGFSDRIEHCSEATDSVQKLLKGSGLMVVTQPSFLYDSAERYAQHVPRHIQPWLYPLASLRNMGLAMAAGSDAPVSSPNPWRGIYGAVKRRGVSGKALHPEQSLSLDEALGLYTLGSAAASQEIDIKGSIEPGKLADIILIDRAIREKELDGLLDSKVVLTMIGGRIAWEQ